jgi:hypothetical protein
LGNGYKFISSLQRNTQTNSYFGYLLTGQPFLHFPVEIAKTNNCWPTTIFIVVGQQLFFLSLNAGEIFFKWRRKELVDFKILYCASPFSQI